MCVIVFFQRVGPRVELPEYIYMPNSQLFFAGLVVLLLALCLTMLMWAVGRFKVQNMMSISKSILLKVFLIILFISGVGLVVLSLVVMEPVATRSQNYHK